MIPPSPIHHGQPLAADYRTTGRQTRSAAVAARWASYLEARELVDRAAARLGKLVTAMGWFARPPMALVARIRVAAVSVMQAFAAATRARVAYRRAADMLHVQTSWRGAEGEAAWHCRLGYPIALARAFTVAAIGGPGAVVRW